MIILRNYLWLTVVKFPLQRYTGLWDGSILLYYFFSIFSKNSMFISLLQVSVSSMPGHTRHIQSLILDEQVELLDCPGLVLPAYAVAPDLLLTAVLPIDQVILLFPYCF